MGNVQHLLPGGNGRVEDLSDGQLDVLTKRAEGLATQKGHPPAVAHAMVDRDSRIMQATNVNTGAPCFVLESQVLADPNTFLNPSSVKEPGKALLVRSGRGGCLRPGAGGRG